MSKISKSGDTHAKEEFLEFYLNSIYLGRSSWDVEMARSYFGKWVKNGTTRLAVSDIFYINQIMEFGKFMAIVQPHPTDKSQIIMALGIKTKLLDRKK